PRRPAAVRVDRTARPGPHARPPQPAAGLSPGTRGQAAMITDRARFEVARVPCDPARATVYGEGWQSWSPTEVRPATAPPEAVTAPAALVIDFQYASPPTSGTHQGSGL